MGSFVSTIWRVIDAIMLQIYKELPRLYALTIRSQVEFQHHGMRSSKNAIYRPMARSTYLKGFRSYDRRFYSSSSNDVTQSKSSASPMTRTTNAALRTDGKQSNQYRELAFDTSELTHLRNMNDDETSSSGPLLNQEPVKGVIKEEESPLAKDLKSYIRMKGPMTLRDYMAQCLNHPTHGYYQRKSLDNKIGGQGKGDFITAPELSQLFGEIIGVWLISTWTNMGSPERFYLIEMGPGLGTLMCDILRVAKKFPTFLKAMDIRFIELSETMRSKQREALKCRSKDLTNLNNGQYITEHGVGISWHNFLDEIPMDRPCLIIGQEFLDIFPVHQFVYHDKVWREKLVDVDGDPSSPCHFRIVIAPRETPAVRALMGGKKGTLNGLRNAIQTMDSQKQQSEESKENVTSKETSESQSDNAMIEEGTGVEICPLALATAEDVAIRINKVGGAGLFIDYGENHVQADSIRAFKSHQQVHFLSEPGIVDITADVDFASIATVAGRKGRVFGPVTQAEFLLSMGIIDRAEKLIEMESTSEDDAEKLVESCKILIDPKQMGSRFKVLCITDHKTEVFGFQ